jgi:formate dehydrogenase subunit delta
MSPDKLVMMANQIGTFFVSQGHDKATAGVADHIKKFWDPRMRAAIFAYVREGGQGLQPDVRLAVETLARETERPVEQAAPRGGNPQLERGRRRLDIHALLRLPWN